MKYCKKCGVLYARFLETCPKCNERLTAPPEMPQRDPTPRERRRRWVALCLGIPAFICFLYLLGWTYKQLGAMG